LLFKHYVAERADIVAPLGLLFDAPLPNRNRTRRSPDRPCFEPVGEQIAMAMNMAIIDSAP
jgi:hypothetical protein